MESESVRRGESVMLLIECESSREFSKWKELNGLELELERFWECSSMSTCYYFFVGECSTVVVPHFLIRHNEHWSTHVTPCLGVMIPLTHQMKSPSDNGLLTHNAWLERNARALTIYTQFGSVPMIAKFIHLGHEVWKLWLWYILGMPNLLPLCS